MSAPIRNTTKAARRLKPEHEAVIRAARDLIEDGYSQAAPYAHSAFASLRYLQALHAALDAIPQRKRK